MTKHESFLKAFAAVIRDEEIDFSETIQNGEILLDAAKDALCEEQNE